MQLSIWKKPNIFARGLIWGLSFMKRWKTEQQQNNKGKEGQTHTQHSKIEAVSFWQPFHGGGEKQQEQQSETI